MFNARNRWLAGRRARVDGIDFVMPVANAASPAFSAIYTIDGAAAAHALPGQELHPLTFGGRGLLLLAVVDYQATAIGTYIEFCVGIVCTKGPRPRGAVRSLLMPRRSGVGAYICDLPVSTQISVKGGRGIWGMAKRQANLDFMIGDDKVSSQYSLDDRLVVRVDVPRPAKCRLPVRFTGTGYGAWRGLLTRSTLRLRGRAGLAFGRRKQGSLVIGDHPQADLLRRLEVSEHPLFTCFIPEATGVLDDYVESWFLTADSAPAEPELDLTDVIDLDLSTTRLAPPDRSVSDLAAQRTGTSAIRGERRLANAEAEVS